MEDEKLHRFGTDVRGILLPGRFTYPFHYTPHPLCLLAAEEVQHYVASRVDWADELAKGKMFGVLVVEDEAGGVGYLAAFSGNLVHSNQHEFFVPPVYDLLQPDGFFKKEEEEISALNHRIASWKQSPAYLEARLTYEKAQAESARVLQTFKEEMKLAKLKRDRLRQQSLTDEEEANLVRESQFQKAEYKRLERKWKAELDTLETRLRPLLERIEAGKAERKRRSAALQLRLFSQFRFLNARGEQADLCTLFADTPTRVPPAGAGECAAPKLLQYAYLHHLRPRAMAEFWWGASPVSEVRHAGHFYPACQGKCGPILRFMLQGLEVDDDPLAKEPVLTPSLEILYEDAYLLVVNKPAGMLSVPGKGARTSVYAEVRRRYPEATGPLLVHRLDMDTSGLLLIAKRKDIHQALQAQFKHRAVRKQYVAWLEGSVQTDKGVVDLPLRPDPLDRPRQLVDKVQGKPAVTRFEVLRREGGRTLVAFYPETGRTHQLRVHAAHPEGLGHPIVGDPLYGTSSTRLYLHAARLTFRHPATGEEMTIKKEAAW